MGIIKQDEILGYWVNEKLLCLACDDNKEEYTQDSILTSDEVEKSDDLYFCDKCEKQIN